MPYIYTVKDQHGVVQDVAASPDLILDSADVYGGPLPSGWMIEREFLAQAPQGARVVWGDASHLCVRIAEALAHARARDEATRDAEKVVDSLRVAYDAALNLCD